MRSSRDARVGDGYGERLRLAQGHAAQRELPLPPKAMAAPSTARTAGAHVTSIPEPSAAARMAEGLSGALSGVAPGAQGRGSTSPLPAAMVLRPVVKKG